MKRSIRQFGRARHSWTLRWVAAGVSLLMASCGPAGRLGAGESRTFQIPMPDETGHYRLTNVEIASFTEPQHLRGDAAEIVVDPREDKGAVVSSLPAGRFVQTRAGVMVAGNYVSLLAATIQAHTERLRIMNAEVGLPDSLLSWPARIGVEANVKSRQTQAYVRSNALFDRRLNALLLVPYSDLQVPIGMNAGVIAHEHFHRIFEALVLSKLESKDVVAPTHDPRLEPSADQTDTILRALNEGFADYWAWVYTGDEDWLKESLAKQARARSLKPASPVLATLDDIKANLEPDRFRSPEIREQVRIDFAYRIGTFYARTLKSLTAQAFGTTRKDRLEGARILVQSLPELAEAARAAQEAKTPVSTLAILQSLKRRLPKGNTDVCDTLRVASRGVVKCD